MSDLGYLAVIINCHNSEKFLRDTLSSLAEQTFDRIKVFVINNQSTDKTVEIAESFKDRCTLEILNTPELVPLASARNFALDQLLNRSELRYFCFCDSDDYVAPDWAKTLMEIAELHDYDLVHCNGHIDNNGVMSPADNFFLGRIYRYRNPIYLNSCIINVDFFNTHLKTLDDDIPELYDHDMWIRALSAGCRFAHTSDRLFFYRKHSGGLSNDLMNIVKQREKIRKKHNFSFFRFHLFTLEIIWAQYRMNKSN